MPAEEPEDDRPRLAALVREYLPPSADRRRVEAILFTAKPAPEPVDAGELAGSRDQILRTIKARLFPHATARHAAREIRRELERYQDGAWKNHRGLTACPTRHGITPYLFAILKAGPIPSDSTIRRALSLSQFEPSKGVYSQA